MMKEQTLRGGYHCCYLRVAIIPREEGETCEQRVGLCEHPFLVQLVLGRGADCIVGRGQLSEDLYEFYQDILWESGHRVKVGWRMLVEGVVIVQLRLEGYILEIRTKEDDGEKDVVCQVEV